MTAVDLVARAADRPRPGLAPCAILICIMSELTRYSVVTPKRPEATCLMAERIESPLGSGLKRSDSSPPSPVFDLPPMRFIAMASVVCASRLIEPKDIAPVAKRLTMSLAGSTSSSGTTACGPSSSPCGCGRARAWSCSRSLCSLISVLAKAHTVLVACCRVRHAAGWRRFAASRHGPRRGCGRRSRRRHRACCVAIHGLSPKASSVAVARSLWRSRRGPHPRSWSRCR